MRQGQSHQNKNRPRGRGGRNKGGNQPNRNMESNGPDVRIRGTAAHIAEKYTSLARDAQSASSGDLVAAENYLQHAEHYNRLIAATQAAQAAQASNRNEDSKRQNADSEGGRDSRNGPKAGKSEAEDSTKAAIADADGPQPVFDDVPAEVALKQTRPNGDGEEAVAETKPAVRRRTRRAPRRPRKDQVDSDALSSADAPTEAQAELPAFIVGES